MNKMDNKQKKKYIQNHLQEVDENTVNELFEMIYSVLQKDDHIVGYNAAGKPIQKKQFIEDILQAESQIKNGEFITLEQLKEESKDW